MMSLSIPSFVEIVSLVPGKKIFKGFFTIYGHGGNLGHVTRIMLIYINFHFHVTKSLHLVNDAPVVSEKSKV